MIIRNYFRHNPNPEAKEALQTFLPPTDATAENSADQFEYFLKNAKFEYDIEDQDPVQVKLADAHSEILTKTVETPANIELAERRFGFKTPELLKQFIQTKGLITIQDALQDLEDGTVEASNRIPLFAFYDHGDPVLMPNLMDLPSAIANNFTDHFMASEYSPAQIAALKKFTVFAYLNHNEQEYDYLFFTENGHFGSFHFAEDDYPQSKKNLDSMLNLTSELESFDRLITRYISKTIIEFANRLSDC